MDGGAFTFTTLGLGSTLGLVVIACIGLSSSSGALSSSGSPANTVLDYVLHTLDSVKASPARAKLEETWHLLSTVMRDYVFFGLVSVIGMASAGVKEYHNMKNDYHARYGDCSWRNFSKLLRIVKIWEPLPYDLMVGHSSSALAQPLEDKVKDGLIGVCLRFRIGSLRHRLHGRISDPRMVYSRELSVPAYLPLEEDGSLRVDLIREKFYVEELELLIPGRYEIHRVSAGDRISAFLLHQLTQEWGYVNVVEHEDIYCRKRRRFRQWLRSTRIHYVARLACYVAAIFASAAIGYFPSYYASFLFPGNLWWCLCHSIGMTVTAVGYEMLFEYRRRKHGSDIPWHALPRRYSAYWLNPRVQGMYL